MSPQGVESPTLCNIVVCVFHPVRVWVQDGIATRDSSGIFLFDMQALTSGMPLSTQAEFLVFTQLLNGQGLFDAESIREENHVLCCTTRFQPFSGGPELSEPIPGVFDQFGCTVRFLLQDDHLVLEDAVLPLGVEDVNGDREVGGTGVVLTTDFTLEQALLQGAGGKHA